MISSRDLTAVILAGGKTQKADGAIASLQEVEGRKVIERQAQLLKPKVSRIEVSASAPAPWSRFPVTLDQYDPIGPLAGIASSLKYASTDYLLIVDGRLAWINPDVLDLLVARSGEPFDACAIRFNFANPNPLFAIYHKRCAQRAIDRLERGDHDAMGLLTSESLAVRWIEDYEIASFDPELKTFKVVETGPGPTPALPEPKQPTVVATAPSTVPVAFDPGEGSRFAFQSTPAYQSGLAFVAIAFSHAKIVDAELGGELKRASLALLTSLADGTINAPAVYRCAALLDAVRVFGNNVTEGDQLLATLAKQL